MTTLHWFKCMQDIDLRVIELDLCVKRFVLAVLLMCSLFYGPLVAIDCSTGLCGRNRGQRSDASDSHKIGKQWSKKGLNMRPTCQLTDQTGPVERRR